MAKLTMADVARLAGVAESTVSRALKDSPLVSDATKERVLAIARQNGYSVNATASSLRRKSADAIGLVIPLAPESGQTVSDPFFLEIIGAVTERATGAGYDLLVTLPSESGRLSRRRLLSTGRADGLIVIGQAGRHQRLNELVDDGAPLVVWGGRMEGQRYITVGSDNVLGGKLATEHLLALGRRRILFLGDASLPEVALRHDGFLDALTAYGLQTDPALECSTPFAGETAREMVARRIGDGADFDAVFAASDMLAFSAIRALRDAGKSVPEDVSVVGYDDITLAAQATMPLTTISQDIHSGGERLVDLLLGLIHGDAPTSEFTRTRLVPRASCGAAL